MTASAIPHAPIVGALSRVRAWALTETGLARLGTAVVALHVIDDSFLQPQPGTSAGDHLAGGLIPVAVLAAGAVFYPRLRAGLRATLALAFGLFGLIVGAGEAGYYTLRVGPSGDDYTGLVAIAAGFLLLAVGATTLWKSRRLDDGRAWRYVRRSLLAVATVGTLAEVVFPIALGYGTTHIQRPVVPVANFGLAYKDVSFETNDGLTLHGWYVPSRNGAAVIAFPGRRGPQRHVPMLARHGYGVLLFDRRGEGESDGDGNMFGWGGEKDIHAAAEFLKSRPDVDPGRIGGIGFSVGGELMLEAAAETDDLAAVVSEGAGTRSYLEEMEELHGTEKWIGVPLLAVKTVSVAMFSNTAPPPKLTDLASRIHEPLFVIWAPNGGNAETMSPVYYKLAKGPKTLWEIPDAKHIGGITAHPKEYERRVIAFFDRSLLSTTTTDGTTPAHNSKDSS